MMRVVVLGLASLWLCSAGAQALDLSTALERGLAHDRRLQAVRARSLAEQETPQMARARLLPAVTLTLSRGETSQERSDVAGLNLNQRYDTEQRVLALRQPVYAPRLRHAVAQADAQAQAAQAEVRAEVLVLLQRVSEAYFNAVLASEKSSQIDILAQLAQARLRAAERALQAGTGTRTDIMDVRAELDLLASQAIQARQARTVAEADLAAIVGLPGVQTKALANRPAEAWRLSLPEPEVLQQRMLATHPEIAQRSHQLEAADKSLRAAQAEHRPTADLVVQHAQSQGENSFFSSSRLQAQSIALQFQWPLYQGGYVDARVRQATASREEAAQRLEEARDRIWNDLRRALATFHEQSARWQALATALESAQLTVLANQRSAEVGVRSQLDVMVAEQRLAQVRLQMSEARALMLQAWIKARAWSGDDAAVLLRESSAWFGG